MKYGSRNTIPISFLLGLLLVLTPCATLYAQDDEDDSRKKRVKRVLLPRFTYLRNDIDPIITIYDYVPKLENFINNVWNEKYKE